MSNSEPLQFRARIVDAIDKPLGFYVLSLLIVETFIGTIAGLAKISDSYQFYCLLMGAGLFVYITLIVTILVWAKAENLTFNQAAHLKTKKAPYGSDKRPISSLDDQKPTRARH